MNNAIKHGKATLITISFHSENGTIVLAIKNNGLSFRKDSKDDKGMGMRSMQYRAGIIGASLDIKGNAEGGTIVTCTFQDTKKEQRKSKQ